MRSILTSAIGTSPDASHYGRNADVLNQREVFSFPAEMVCEYTSRDCPHMYAGNLRAVAG
jgi:hypothetical protein